MPRRPDDDDAPRWEPPAPSTEAPTWESSAADDVPRWDPNADVPRWEPEPETPRWTPPAAPPVVRAPAPSAGTAPARRGAPAGGPLAWWRDHPWIGVWGLVLAIPLVAIGLRIVDESEQQAFVAPLAWLYVALVAASLVVAAVARARRGSLRLALGLAGALLAAGLLTWPVTRVTLGRAPCPRRAGPDLGAPAAAAALAAWRQGVSGDAGWRGGRVDPAWAARAGAVGVLDYSLVATGCWERVAPVDGSRTWHEFRVTVRAGTDNPLSKVVVVHTARSAQGWKITAIEGPLP